MTDTWQSPSGTWLTHRHSLAHSTSTHSLSLTAVRKQLESSHVTFNTLLQYDTLLTTSQCCVKVLLLTPHYTQKHTPRNTHSFICFFTSVFQCNTELKFVSVCMWCFKWANTRYVSMYGRVGSREPFFYLELGPLKKTKKKNYVFFSFLLRFLNVWIFQWCVFMAL